MKTPRLAIAPEPIAGLPEWARPKVEAEFAALRRGNHLKPKQAAILGALENDLRMRSVWKELSRRSRATGEFVHPMQPSLIFPDIFPPFYTAEDKQAIALAQVVQFTFRVIVHPGYFAVRKPKDIAKARKKLMADASTLRRLATTECRGQDVEALWRTADLLQAEAADLKATDDDPFVMTRDCGDRIERGVQIRLAQLLRERFGKPLYTTAATLTAVALGTKKRSRQISRSALTRAGHLRAKTPKTAPLKHS